MGRSYDDALAIFGGKNNIEWDRVLDELERIDNESNYPECIMLYNSNSDLMPKFFNKTNLDNVDLGDSLTITTAKPDIVELFIYEEGKCREVFDKALVSGYLDFKDFDGAMLTYKNIPESSSNNVRKVLIDLTNIKKHLI